MQPEMRSFVFVQTFVRFAPSPWCSLLPLNAVVRKFELGLSQAGHWTTFTDIHYKYFTFSFKSNF